MAKPKRPKFSYFVADKDGDAYTDCTRLKDARSHVREADKAWPEDAPHRIYALVTLQERAVIRAAERLVKSWDSYDADEAGLRAGIEETLARAVEAARG